MIGKSWPAIILFGLFVGVLTPVEQISALGLPSSLRCPSIYKAFSVSKRDTLNSFDPSLLDSRQLTGTDKSLQTRSNQ